MTQNRLSWDTVKATALWLEGKTAGDIAAQVGAPSRSAILGYINRMGIVRDDQPGRQSGQRTAKSSAYWTPERCLRAQTMWLDGESAAAIARALGGVSRNGVAGRMHRLGLQKPAMVRIPKAQAAKAAERIAVPGAKPSVNWGKGTVSVALLPDLTPVQAMEAAPDQAAALKTFAQLERDECRWPIGSPDPVKGQMFCGASTPWRKSYCRDHSPALGRELRPMGGRQDMRVIPVGPMIDEPIADLTEMFA